MIARATGGAPNPLRGEFEAELAGEAIVLDTTLGTVAIIEERCGGLDLVGAVERAVFGRRATDRMALIAGALRAAGREDAEALAAQTSTLEAERFVLALMGALGFELARRPGLEQKAGGESQDPFARAPEPSGARAGGAGAASPSAP